MGRGGGAGGRNDRPRLEPARRRRRSGGARATPRGRACCGRDRRTGCWSRAVVPRMPCVCTGRARRPGRLRVRLRDPGDGRRRRSDERRRLRERLGRDPRASARGLRRRAPNGAPAASSGWNTGARGFGRARSSPGRVSARAEASRRDQGDRHGAPGPQKSRTTDEQAHVRSVFKNPSTSSPRA